METKALADLLRAIANLVEAPDPESLTRLTQQLARTKSGSHSPRTDNGKAATNARSTLLQDVRDELLKATTREKGYEVLSRGNLSHKDLVEIARSAQVHINKSDNIQITKEKLVETIVGSQLNARAIRGFDE